MERAPDPDVAGPEQRVAAPERVEQHAATVLVAAAGQDQERAHLAAPGAPPASELRPAPLARAHRQSLAQPPPAAQLGRTTDADAGQRDAHEPALALRAAGRRLRQRPHAEEVPTRRLALIEHTLYVLSAIRSDNGIQFRSRSHCQSSSM